MPDFLAYGWPSGLPLCRFIGFLVWFFCESAAYREAGHISAAVAQKMPLQEQGIHIDVKGSGISYYWHRTPGDKRNTEQDRIERELFRRGAGSRGFCHRP
jgi:hypothetical protein